MDTVPISAYWLLVETAETIPNIQLFLVTSLGQQWEPSKPFCCSVSYLEWGAQVTSYRTPCCLYSIESLHFLVSLISFSSPHMLIWPWLGYLSALFSLVILQNFILVCQVILQNLFYQSRCKSPHLS